MIDKNFILETSTGWRAIGELKVGDAILTSTGEEKAIIWIDSRSVFEMSEKSRMNLAPIRILPGALGAFQPSIPLLVSPKQILSVNWDLSLQNYDKTSEFVSANSLLSLDGVDIVSELSTFEYTYFDIGEDLRINCWGIELHFVSLMQ